jgi:hypothetical protein
MDPVTPSTASASQLPPLPDFSANGGGSGPSTPPSFLASIMSGIAPVKNAVDSINAACKQIVQSGSVPGAEQVCGQIVALAQSLLPMAAQQALQPTGPAPGPTPGGGLGGPGGPGGGLAPVGGPNQ